MLSQSAPHKPLAIIEGFDYIGSMLKKLSYSFLLSSSAIHVFCCGIPAVMSLFSITALFGLSGGIMMEPAWFNAIEFPLLVLSASLLALTGALHWISTRMDCRTDGHCVHPPCDSEKHRARIIYSVALGLFILNLIHYILAH